MSDQHKLAIAQTLISKFMADEEMKYKDARDHDRFYSVVYLNWARDFFDMPHVPKLPQHAVPPESEAVRSDREAFLENQTQEDLDYLLRDRPDDLRS